MLGPRAPEAASTTGELGVGSLSPAARERLSRAPVPPLRPPPLDDLRAVAIWRSAVHAAWLEGDPSPETCGHRHTVVDGVPCLSAAPAVGTGTGATIVYCHGGGYALGSPEVALAITERLSPRADVVSVDYRLAPESPYPAGLDDCHAVFRRLRAERTMVVLAGDSAGANLALATTLRARDRNEAGPDALVLLSPHLDLGPAPGPAARAAGSNRADVDAVTADWLHRAYCGDHAPTDPGISPLRADLAGLAPTLVQVGSEDSALDHALRFARRARLTGAPVTLDVWSGLWHTWHYHRQLPEADGALSEVGDFVAGAAR